MTQYIGDINAATPDNADYLSQGAGEIRTLKSQVLSSFPKVRGEVSASASELNLLVGITGGLVGTGGGSISGTMTFGSVVNLNSDVSVSGGFAVVGTSQFKADVTISGTLVCKTHSIFEGTANFSVAPRVPNPTGADHATPKTYVDAAVLGGGDPSAVDVSRFKAANMKLFFFGQLG